MLCYQVFLVTNQNEWVYTKSLQLLNVYCIYMYVGLVPDCLLAPITIDKLTSPPPPKVLIVTLHSTEMATHFSECRTSLVRSKC